MYIQNNTEVQIPYRKDNLPPPPSTSSLILRYPTPKNRCVVFLGQ